MLSFSNCSWSECDVDKGQSVIKKNVLELANLPLEGYFLALYAPLGGPRTWREKAFLDIVETPCLHVQR